jgi:hypothetical protein
MVTDMLKPSHCLRRERRNLPFVSLVIGLPFPLHTLSEDAPAGTDLPQTGSVKPLAHGGRALTWAT